MGVLSDVAVAVRVISTGITLKDGWFVSIIILILYVPLWRRVDGICISTAL